MPQVIRRQESTRNTGRQIIQTAHGFTPGQQVYFDNATSTWLLAKADSEATLKEGIVAEIDNENAFLLVYAGAVTIANHGLELGTLYYLSPTVAGGYTKNRPSRQGQYIQIAFEVIDANNILVEDLSAIEVGAEIVFFQKEVEFPASELNGGCTGGGSISSANNSIKWSQRFIWMSNVKNRDCPSGYFDITMPPLNTVIPSANGGASVTVTADGIPMTGWMTLWYILPLRATNAVVHANYRVAMYNSPNNFTPEPHWVRVAVYNSERGLIYWCDGRMTRIADGSELYTNRAGDTMTGTLTFNNGTADSVAINAQGRYINNLHAPGNSGGDAANKTYVDARVAKAGDTMTGQLTVNNNILVNSGGNYYLDSSDNNNGSGKGIYYRSSDGQSNATLYAKKVGRVSNTNEANFDLSMGCGGYGWRRVFVCTVDSPPRTSFDGDVYSRGNKLTSDIREKYDIKPATSTFNLGLIKPIEFRFKDTPGEGADLEWIAKQPKPALRLGFSAQEVQQVDSRLVSKANDGTLAVDVGGILATLVSTLQAQNERIKSLETALGI
jgi:hypothetical protein